MLVYSFLYAHNSSPSPSVAWAKSQITPTIQTRAPIAKRVLLFGLLLSPPTTASAAISVFEASNVVDHCAFLLILFYGSAAFVVIIVR